MFLLNESSLWTGNTSTSVELLETTSMGYKMPKARIRTVLQTLDEVNKNNRIYPSRILERAVRDIKPLIMTRALLGELDHPIVTGNDQADAYRHFVVLYEKASHIIEEITVEGNVIYGVVETSLTEPGFKMAGLIMDKVPVGFSLRAIGESTRRRDGVTEIAAPFNIVTYDCVSNPSHAKARMVEVVAENFSHLREGTMPYNSVADDIACDRSNLLMEALQMGNLPPNKLEKLVESLSDQITEGDRNGAEKTVDKMLAGYLGEKPEYQTPDMFNFLDEYVNGKGPLEQLFKKYLA